MAGFAEPAPVRLRVLDARLGVDFPLPDYATSGSAGMDLRAMVEGTTRLAPGETILIPTGVSTEASCRSFSSSERSF